MFHIQVTPHEQCGITADQIIYSLEEVIRLVKNNNENGDIEYKDVTISFWDHPDEI